MKKIQKIDRIIFGVFGYRYYSLHLFLVLLQYLSEFGQHKHMNAIFYLVLLFGVLKFTSKLYSHHRHFFLTCILQKIVI